MTESSACRLSELYLYQNAKTGQPSATPVSVEQLCRILGTGTTHVTANTMVWKVGETPTDDAQEWKVLKDIPVLLEASAQWYCTNSSGESKGPVNAKALEHRRRNGEISSEKTMVWSPQLESKGWFPLEKSQELMLALSAYAPPPLIEKEKNNDQPEKMSNEQQPMDEVQAELQAFLSSAGAPSSHDQRHQANKIEEEGYQSDGGTNYIKDPISGKWIHEALVPKVAAPNNKRPTPPQSDSEPQQQNNTKRKRKKTKFANRNAKCWIYVSGLPLDTDEDEVSKVFSKVGILDLDADTQKPKIKLYSNKNASEGGRVLKGDASICFARPESVGLALQLLDETPFRLEDHKSLMRVERAKFEQRGDDYKARPQSWQKRQVAKTATLQAVGWDEGLNGRITGGMKGLTIIVLKNMFTVSQSRDDEFLAQMEKQLRKDCHGLGTVEKITVFASNPEGVVIVRFKESAAATNAIQKFNGESQDNRNKIEAHFWDGVTDYTVKDRQQEEKEEKERHKEFGDWLEQSQADLPEELRLQVET